MKRATVWVVVAVFLGLLSVWLHADSYPHTVYGYHQTGEVAEFFYRAAGLRVEAVPVFVPDNPAWVTTIRAIAPFTLFVLFMVILYLLVGRRGEPNAPPY